MPGLPLTFLATAAAAFVAAAVAAPWATSALAGHYYQPALFALTHTLLKIVPYLVWSAVYASRVGLRPIPSVEALSWPAAERLAWGLLTPGMAGLTPAVATASEIWFQRATLAAAARALVFAVALAHALWPLLARAGATPLALAGSRR